MYTCTPGITLGYKVSTGLYCKILASIFRQTSNVYTQFFIIGWINKVLLSYRKNVYSIIIY